MKRIEYMAKYNDIYLLTIIDNEDELKYKENLELFCKEVHMFPRNSLFNSIWQCFAFPYQAVSRWNQALCNKYNELCKFITPEYVIVDSPQMMGVVLKNKEVLKKVILNQHNIEYKTLFSLSKTKKNLIQKKAFKVTGLQMQLYEANLYRNNIYLYTFVSKSDKLLFEKKYNKKNTLLVPVGTEIKDDVKIVNTQNILFVGKLSYSPNEEGILWFIDNVFNKILDSCCNASLYIVGKNPTKEILKRATINKNIIVTGPVDNLDEYYDIVDLVI
ncbi:glycosyltransferase family 4 protein, partial [bacterium]|nr:glycosyltransferase family 4 protein [bacterium]